MPSEEPDMFIIEFPGEWYLRNTTATGDIERATRFNTEKEAVDHLRDSKSFKFAAKKGARILRLSSDS